MKKYLEIKSRKAMGVRVKRPSNWWIHVIMVLAGVIAGYVPAKRAVSIKLVDALTS